EWGAEGAAYHSRRTTYQSHKPLTRYHSPLTSIVSLYFPTSDECARHTIFPGVDIRTCSVEKMMMSVVEFAPHAVVEEHQHPHEQVGMLLEGRAIFFIGAEQKTLQAGDPNRIPGNLRHK